MADIAACGTGEIDGTKVAVLLRLRKPLDKEVFNLPAGAFFCTGKSYYLSHLTIYLGNGTTNTAY